MQIISGICDRPNNENNEKMAKTVDVKQSDPNYKKMSDDFENSIAFSACDLVFKGRIQPSDILSHYYIKKD